MRRIVAVVSLTLDGVMQAPGRADEDRRGGFAHGGWAQRFFDPVMLEAMGEGMSQGAGLLFGRRTYEDFFSVWPGRTDNPFTAVLDASRKYVCSRTLREPLPWQNSTLLAGEAAETVARLKEQPGPDLTVLGCAGLVQTLTRHRLVDAYVLLIHPLVLGSGRRLFGDDVPHTALRTVKTVATTTGVVIVTYEPA
ncbi:MAG: dihydrofolate reductase family protein [Vicinamibacteria bacterium]